MAVPALTQALSDSEPLERRHAAWALGRIGGEQSREWLRAALGNEQDATVRQELRYALRMLAAQA